MMSGQALVRTLQALNYPNVESLDPQSLDYMFENEALAPMLQWFCHNVNQSNLLKTEEFAKFKTLKQSGDVLLKGRELDEALSNFDFIQDDSVSKESLQEEVNHLQYNLHHYKKQKARLSKRRSMLSNFHVGLSHRLSKLSGVESKVKQQYMDSLSQMYADNTQMNESLERVTSSVQDTEHLYDASGKKVEKSKVAQSNVPCQPGAPSMFLSQVPVQPYYTTEEGFTTQLTAYTKKQFFQGIAQMAGGEEVSRYEILEVSDPDSLLVRGESGDVNIRDCKELARLQGLFVKNETGRLQALSELKKLKAYVQHCRNTLQSLSDGAFGTDATKNRDRLQKVQASVQTMKPELTSLADKDLPQLMQECRDAKVLRVLTGDYNLKLSRQDYFTSNQDRVIHQLIQQRARNEFLTMALEVELRQHRHLHHLLTSLFTQLHGQFTNWQARMTVMEDPALTPARHKRETIDSRDKSTARLYHMLNEEKSSSSDHQLFLTYSALVENARKLQEKHAGLVCSLQTSSNTDHYHVEVLERNADQCEKTIYAWSSTTTGMPLLTPRPIDDLFTQLKAMLQPLQQGIMEILKDVDSKKKLLKSDALLSRERKLFTYFFNNNQKLHQTLEELLRRLKAEKAHGQS